MHKFPEGRNQRSAVIGAQFLNNRNGFIGHQEIQIQKMELQNIKSLSLLKRND